MKKLVRTAAWIAAPKWMAAAKNPGKAALFVAGKWAAGREEPEPEAEVVRREPVSPASLVLKGLIAALIALPIGLWLGRKLSAGRTG